MGNPPRRRRTPSRTNGTVRSRPPERTRIVSPHSPSEDDSSDDSAWARLEEGQPRAQSPTVSETSSLLVNVPQSKGKSTVTTQTYPQTGGALETAAQTMSAEGTAPLRVQQPNRQQMQPAQSVDNQIMSQPLIASNPADKAEGSDDVMEADRERDHEPLQPMLAALWDGVRRV